MRGIDRLLENEEDSVSREGKLELAFIESAYMPFQGRGTSSILVGRAISRSSVVERDKKHTRLKAFIVGLHSARIHGLENLKQFALNFRP